MIVLPPSMGKYQNHPSIILSKDFGGDNRVRTGDLLSARQALSQLSYIPIIYPLFNNLTLVSRIDYYYFIYIAPRRVQFTLTTPLLRHANIQLQIIISYSFSFVKGNQNHQLNILYRDM